MGLPPHFLAAQEAFEENLPPEATQDPRYAWRVLMIHRNTNSKGRADEIVEFVKPGTEVEGEIHRMLQKEVEKTKYRASDIVSAVRAAGFEKFNMHDHTLLWQEKSAKDTKKNQARSLIFRKEIGAGISPGWMRSWPTARQTHPVTETWNPARPRPEAGGH